MPDQPYYGDATEAHANPDPVWVTEGYGGPALIVTGDVDAARRRLAPIPADTRTAALDVATAAEGEWRFGVNHDRRNLREAIVDALVAAGLIRPALIDVGGGPLNGASVPDAGERFAVVTDHDGHAVRHVYARHGDAYVYQGCGDPLRPSHLDRLAAWAQDSGGAFGVDRIEIGGESMYVAWVEDTSYQRDAETATDPQEAARRVLARLEEQS